MSNREIPKSSKNQTTLIIILLIPVALLTIFISYIFINSESIDNNQNPISELVNSNEKSNNFTRFGLNTNTSKAAINVDKVLSGGPGKDGIPAIDSPEFVTVAEADSFVEDEFLGIFVDIEGVKRYYPNNILVWHEIVNDQIGDKEVAVTFCPLCGSAIVFDRNIGDQTLSFGVSGLLYESNLLMYDRGSESLWSQIEGRAVVGDFAETDLEIIESQLISFKNIKDKYPDAQVLSTQTGFQRDYNRYPYGDYETNNDFIFPVTYLGEDINVESKTIMFASNIDDIPVAFGLNDLKEVKEVELELPNGKTITARHILDENTDEIQITDNDGNAYPGYFTMWFSWSNHNLENGVGPEKNGQFWFS